jgi:competence protein ComEC
MPVAVLVALAGVVALLWLGVPEIPFAVPGLGALALALSALRGPRVVVLTLIATLPVMLADHAIHDALADRWVNDPERRDRIVTGTVCEFPRVQPGVVRFVLDVDPGAGADLPERMLVSWYDRDPGLQVPAPAPGERWRLSLRLRPPRGLRNPGGFDYERWLFSARLGAIAWVRAEEGGERLATESAVCSLGGFRAALAERIGRHVEGDAARAWILGLTVGAYQSLPEKDWELLRRTGTTHLVSISGFHVVLVSMPFAGLGLLLGMALLRLGRRCRPRVIGAAFGALAALGYGLIAGFSVPTARSVFALLLVAVLVCLRRRVGVVAAFALVVWAVLVLEPLAPLTPGFWLSFAGVGVLVACAALVGRRCLPAFLGTQLLMPVALAPLLVAWFGELPVTGALANFVAVPVFSVVLLPLTLLGGALAAFSVTWAGPVLDAAATCFELWRAFLVRVAALPLALVPVPAPGGWAVAVGCLAVVGLLWPAPAIARGLAVLVLLAVVSRAPAAVPEGTARITVLDVGQGLSVLVRTRTHALLYDAGPAYAAGDAGERVVVPSLRSLGIRRLDRLLISHADADHAGGVPSVLAALPVDRVLGPVPGAGERHACVAGERWAWDGVRFEVLHPDPAAPARSRNAGSCVLLIDAGGTRALLPGDIEAPEEEQLLAAGHLPPVDLMVVPHHGSRSSSTPAFVAHTMPAVAVYTNGHGNRWGFPRPEVQARWQAIGACTLSTAEEGAIEIGLEPGQPPRLRALARREAFGVWVIVPGGFDGSGACWK